ncbi:HAD family hydrolase [uncultured Oscillibacter sp.]|uniref:HAD family hydrolase n=1 Tax=uncultured Oscillibacter sp. TaxID=876091 RepID=UPI0025E607E7|nr:HAD family hydrolase [uncultured Oscillibacter sp.]
MDNKGMDVRRGPGLFLSDVDGTLLKTREPVPPAALAAVRRWMEAGGRFALSTGRCLRSARRLVEEIPVNAPCILCGGALVYDFSQDRALYARPLEEGTLGKLEAVLEGYPGVSVTVTTQEEVYNLRVNGRLRARGVEEDANAPLAALGDVRGAVVKVLFTEDDPAVLEELRERLFSGGGETFSFASRHFCELTARGVDKGSAAAFLRGLFGGCRMYTAGDAMSDVYMAEISDRFFAPLSAPGEVRARADRLFPPPWEGGIAEAFRCALEDGGARGERPGDGQQGWRET